MAIFSWFGLGWKVGLLSTTLFIINLWIFVNEISDGASGITEYDEKEFDPNYLSDIEPISIAQKSNSNLDFVVGTRVFGDKGHGTVMQVNDDCVFVSYIKENGTQKYSKDEAKQFLEIVE